MAARIRSIITGDHFRIEKILIPRRYPTLPLCSRGRKEGQPVSTAAYGPLRPKRSVEDDHLSPRETVASTARRANHLRFIRIMSSPSRKNILLPFFGIM